MTTEFTREDTKLIKAIAVFLMVIHHVLLNGNLAANYASSQLYSDLQLAGKLCIGLFLMLSGYGIYYQLQGKEPAGIISGKILGVYKKYWLASLVFFPIAIAMGHSFSLSEIVINLLGVNFTFNGETWFLRSFIVCTCLAPLLCKLVDKLSSVFSGILLVAAVDVVGRLILLEKVRNLPIFETYLNSYAAMWVREVEMYLACFIMGLVCARFDLFARFKALVLRYNKWIIRVIGVLVIAATISFQADNYDTYMHFTSVFIVLGTICLSAFTDGLIKKACCFVGRHSSYIWLTHTYFCFYCFSNIIYASGNAICAVVMTFAFSLVTAIVLERVEKWIRCLL